MPSIALDLQSLAYPEHGIGSCLSAEYRINAEFILSLAKELGTE